MNCKRPPWATFQDDEYDEPPEDWGLADCGHEFEEMNGDPEALAAVVMAHRYEIVALRRQLTGAQAIIDKLPKYADTNITISARGMVYAVDSDGNLISGAMRGFCFCDEDGQEAEIYIADMARSGYWCMPVADCYSTKAAAEAARRKP